jgi:hypothetical protein
MFTSIKQTKHPQVRLSCYLDGLSRYNLIIATVFHGNPATKWWRISENLRASEQGPRIFSQARDSHIVDLLYTESPINICDIKKYMYLLYTWEIDIIKKTKNIIIYICMYISIYTNLKDLHIRNLPMKHQPAMILSPAARLHLGDVGSNLLNL